MKLGIAVVYNFTDKSAPLLDLHLGRIEQHTQVPYTIYAETNRLEPKFKRRLSHHPRVRICDIPKTDLRGDPLYSYYLEHLVQAAIDDGASHVVTMHLDSFPIRPGWEEELVGRLSETCALATLDRVNTACLFFHRDFYCRYRPILTLSEEERSNPLYGRFVSEHKPCEHSGTGYAFRAYQHGLSWYYLKDLATGDSDEIGKVFDDMIFHLEGAIRIGEGYASESRFHVRYGHCVTAIARVCRLALPASVRFAFRRRFGSFLEHNVDRHRSTYLAHQIMQFLQDPEGRLALLSSRASRTPS